MRWHRPLAHPPISSCSPSFSSPAIRRKTLCSVRLSSMPVVPLSRRSPRTPAESGPAVLVGAPMESRPIGCTIRRLLLEGRRIAAIRHKVELPNYGVFDEKRVFAPGPAPEPIAFRGVQIGVAICEDLWDERFCRDIGSAWCRAPDQHSRIALLARQGRAARRGGAKGARRVGMSRSSTSILSAARTSLSSTAARSASIARARSLSGWSDFATSTAAG